MGDGDDVKQAVLPELGPPLTMIGLTEGVNRVVEDIQRRLEEKWNRPVTKSEAVGYAIFTAELLI